MTTPELIALISALGVPSIVGAVITACNGRRMKKIEKSDGNRREENTLILRGLLTIGDLARATGLAVKEGKCNGCMDDALDAHEEYRQQLREFTCRQTADRSK